MDNRYRLIIEYLNAKGEAVIREFLVVNCEVSWDAGIHSFYLNEGQNFNVASKNLITYEYKKLES